MNKRSGITLIALIITIIVLLILAGVTISLVVGDNGILSKSTEAKKQTVIVQEKEQINLAYSAALAKNEGSMVTDEDLQEELDNSVGNGKTVVTVNDDDTLNVLFNDTGHNYTADGHKIEEVESLELHITNYAELLDFANRVNDGESFARYIVYLDNDITMADDEWVIIGTPGSKDEYPMSFEGVFEGNNHTIKEGIFPYTAKIGLFCINEGTIKNLNVEISIGGSGGNAKYCAGGICYQNSGNILNSSVTMSVNASMTNRSFLGGICGNNYGIIDNCRARGNIETTISMDHTKIGGIAGLNYGIVRDCINECSMNIGSADADNSCGGIVGSNVMEGEITKSINVGELSLRVFVWWRNRW